MTSMTITELQAETQLWSLKDVSLKSKSNFRLAGLNLEIHPGVTAVMGYSGAGKTSLLNLLVQFEAPDAGTVSRNNEENNSGLDLFWVPHNLGLWPQFTVREHLALVCPDLKSEKSNINELLTAFRLTEIQDQYPGQISQGEASRLSVARGLASQSRVLVLDEPLVHVDQTHWPEYWETIRKECAKNSTSLVFSTHQPELVMREADQVICLDQGKVIYAGAVDVLYYAPPSSEVGIYLGPVNDLEPFQDSVQNPAAGSQPRLLRAEQLSLEVDPQSPWKVAATRFSGSLEEVSVFHSKCNSTQTLYHRPVRPGLKQGEGVSIRILFLMLWLTILSGCFSSTDPLLQFSKINQWPVPSEGIMVPAPRSLNVGPEDELYVLDNAGRVLVYNSDDQLVRQWNMPESDVGKPEGVCFLRNGQIAVADTHYHRVVFFDPQGKVQKMLGEYGTEPGQFIYPVSIVQDAAGNLYVCEFGDNSRVQKFSEEGKFLLEFGTVGTDPGQFQRPAGMVWHKGKVYVADADNNRIQVFSEDGKFLEVLGTKTRGIPLYYPYDIAIDRGNEELYIVEYGSGRITKIDLTGEILGRYGKTGIRQGEFLTPWGLTVNSKEEVFVADTGNRLVVKLTP